MECVARDLRTFVSWEQRTTELRNKELRKCRVTKLSFPSVYQRAKTSARVRSRGRDRAPRYTTRKVAFLPRGVRISRLKDGRLRVSSPISITKTLIREL